jgi:hypothetical protein
MTVELFKLTRELLRKSLFMNEPLSSQLEWLQDAGEKQARETYEAAAPIYDLLTAHRDTRRGSMNCFPL